MNLSLMSILQIDLYSDIACPWCFIGTRQLAAVIDSLGGGVHAEIRHHAFLLNPGAPPEGIDVRQMLSERYGSDPRPMFARVEAVAREAGIPLDLTRQRRAYDTSAAHTLLRHAPAKGTQSELADALFVAYFLDARNVSDVEVLVDVASRHGFTAEEVRQLLHDGSELALTRLDAQNASRRGVSGVPLFILNERFALSGAQPPEIFREAIEKALEADAVEGSEMVAHG